MPSDCRRGTRERRHGDGRQGFTLPYGVRSRRGAVAVDPDHVRALLQAAARAGESLTYSQVLASLGYAFSRPRMRALCVVLNDVDAGERGAGRPELAVLVVRQSDRLPGQGWWMGETDYRGLFVGTEAAAWVRSKQSAVFAWWARRPA